MRARVSVVVAGRISDAEALWYDTSRWPTFIDGFHHVASVDEGWPAEGTIVWDSTRGGRGRVVEKVERYEPRVEHVVAVEDPTMTGTQTISFGAVDEDRARVSLELRYQLKEKRLGPLTFAMDAIFIRPRQREALARTLARFTRELAADREATAGP